jgi:hypothetical protein
MHFILPLVTLAISTSAIPIPSTPAPGSGASKKPTLRRTGRIKIDQIHNPQSGAPGSASISSFGGNLGHVPLQQLRHTAGNEPHSPSTSAVPARLGLKAAALAWLEAALAFWNLRPGQSHQPRLGPGLAWPRPRLLYVKCSNFAHRSIGYKLIQEAN